MKLLLILSGALITFFSGTHFFNSSESKIDKEELKDVIKKKNRTTIYCSPDWSTYQLTAAEIEQMIPLPGTGTYSWKISTNNDSAQFYFNQAIRLYFGFHIIESLPSFKKAQLFDSSCAMLFWGEALAYGPNINDAGYAERPEPLDAIRHAKKLSGNATAKEKALIDAILSHYSDDSTISRAELNTAYKESMKSAYSKFQNDGEIGTLYADAIMNLHPWDIWDHDGKPKSWTPELISVLENVLKNHPDHPGANHYYIHTMEAGPYAAKANKSAEKLGELAPGVSHLVHMPSHIYIRTGQYDKGVKVNEEAVKMYEDYLNLYPDVINNAFIYDYHNRHMQAACSMNTNDYQKAITDAIECQKSIDITQLLLEPPFGNYLQYMYMTPDLTRVTFERWDDILALPDEDTARHFASLIRSFSKGMAYANTGKINLAKEALRNIDATLLMPELSIVLYPFNSSADVATVAKYILKGIILENENKIEEAIENYRKGVAAEDSLVYQEPRDWLVPARHYLGKALLKQKKYKEAEAVFLKDMTYQPGNYVSTQGLKKARAMQN